MSFMHYTFSLEDAYGMWAQISRVYDTYTSEELSALENEFKDENGKPLVGSAFRKMLVDKYGRKRPLSILSKRAKKSVLGFLVGDALSGNALNTPTLVATMQTFTENVAGVNRYFVEVFFMDIFLKKAGKQKVKNGLSVMLPLAIAHRDEGKSAREEDITTLNSIDFDEKSLPYCIAFCDLYLALLNGKSKEEALEIAGLSYLKDLDVQDIKNTNAVKHLLEMSVYAFIIGNTYLSCIKKAEQFSSDTEGVTAITGSLAALLYRIPKHYMEQLDELEMLITHTERFLREADAYNIAIKPNSGHRWEEIPIEEVDSVDVGNYLELIKSKRKNK